MQINLSSGDYNIISSSQVFLFGEDEHFKLDVVADDGFEFSLILKFVKDGSEEWHVTRDVEGNTITFNCLNFHDRGTGSINPLKLAKVGGKQWFLMFWSNLEGESEKGQARSVRYTIYSEK